MNVWEFMSDNPGLTILLVIALIFVLCVITVQIDRIYEARYELKYGYPPLRLRQLMRRRLRPDDSDNAKQPPTGAGAKVTPIRPKPSGDDTP